MILVATLMVNQPSIFFERAHWCHIMITLITSKLKRVCSEHEHYDARDDCHTVVLLRPAKDHSSRGGPKNGTKSQVLMGNQNIESSVTMV